MAIRYAQGEKRAVDSDSGEYLTTEFIHRDHPTRNFSIYAADGTTLLTAIVEWNDVDVSGDGRVGIHQINVLFIEEWNDERSSVVVDEHSLSAQKLARFIYVFLMDHPGMRPTITTEITFNLGPERDVWHRLGFKR
jgi:hypothetical protein